MLELNPVSKGVVTPHAQRKTGDNVGEHKLEKTLNNRDSQPTESAKAVAKPHEAEPSKRSRPAHLGNHLDTTA